ncbi:MAG: NAD(P)-dependent oxidoreductase [Novosphingobium sp.]
MHSLPLFHRITGQTVIVLGEGDAAEAKRRLVERAGGIVSDDPQAGAQLAFVALDEPDAVAAALKARGVLVNVVDRPELCQFTTPSLLERGDVLVAVGTGGVSAGLAKQLRLRLEALLPSSLAALAAKLGAARAAIRNRWPDAGERRRAIDAALAQGGYLDPLNANSADRFDDWLGNAMSGTISILEFTVTSDDPDDLTLRQVRCLGTADVIAHEPGVPDAILNRARADAVRLPIAPGQPLPESQGSVVILRSR